MSVVLASLAGYFEQQRHVRIFPKGSVIISQGDVLDRMYLVTSGLIKVYDIDTSGSERTLLIAGRHHVFPVAALLPEPPESHLYFYEAFSDVTCYVGEWRGVRRHIDAHPALLVELSANLARAYINAYGRIQNLEKSRVNERLEFVLYYLATNLGTLEHNIARIDAPITQEDLARLVGVTRETMSAEINRVHGRLFWRSNNETYIDLNRLRLADFPAVFQA